MNHLTLDEVLLYVIVGCIIAAAVGAGVGYMLRKRIAEARIGSAEEKARQIGEEAKKCWIMLPGKRKRLRRKPLYRLVKKSTNFVKMWNRKTNSAVMNCRSTNSVLCRRK